MFTNPPFLTSVVAAEASLPKAEVDDFMTDGQYEAEMGYIRDHMLDDICALVSLEEPQYVSASTQSIEYVAVAGIVSKYGGHARR
jgi:hypothetical protein